MSTEAKHFGEAMSALFVSLGILRRKPRKEKTGAKQLDDPEVFKPVLYGISSSLIFRAIAANVITSSRVSLMLNIFQGNSSLAALELGKIRAVGAFLEFLIGPLFGNLSDAYGRKFGMLPSAIMNFVSSTLVLINPLSLYAHWSLVFNIAFDTVYFAQMRAQMADCMSGRNIAENAFMHMAPAGLAMISAPWISGRLNAVQCYRMSSITSLFTIWVLYNQEETLDKNERRKIDLKACNPFAFLALFTNGPSLCTLTLTSGIQTYTDSRLMENSSTLMMKEQLNYSDKQVSALLTRMAVTGFLGVPIGKYSIKAFGRTMHTHISHLFKIIAYCVWSYLTGPTMRYAQWILMFGTRQRDGTETLMTEVGVAKGFGKGQMESYKMNWRSVTNFCAPLIYSRMFVYGKHVGQVHLPLYGAIFFTVLSECIFAYGSTYFKKEKDLKDFKFD